MKAVHRLPIAVLTFIFAAGLIGLSGPATTFAATDPGLGTAATFSVIAQTSITGISTISGDVGINGSGAGITGLTAGDVAGTIYATDMAAPSEALLSPSVQADLSTAYTSNIPGQGSNGSIGPVLDGLVVTPGVYDIGAGRLNGGVLTLNGAGTYIFRASSDFISSGSILLTNGAQACDVYWRVQTLATINGTSFVGSILAGTGVHFGSGVTLNGRALAVGGDVTMLNDVISGPTCASATPVPVGGARRDSTINVVKTVVNDSGGTKIFSDFPLFINGVQVTSGVTANYPAPSGTYTVTESNAAGYTQSFSGDCNAAGQMTLNSGQNLFCILTNNDIGTPVPVVPPLIDVVKVPSPLSLPGGPGPVTYTYTLRNTGTVPVTNVTMVGDTCSPIVRQSGDTNGDNILQTTETWRYTCTTTLSATHTNTVVATGRANGITATDIASATVVVGAPVVPPLIHVTKIPSPLVLASRGGMVTYTERITNPGTVALNNVRLTDDKCSPMVYQSGDTNNDMMLQPSETWTYTCRTNLSATTTNTAIASGDANGLSVRDIAVATVVVATPALPSTGFSPGQNALWGVLVASLFMIVATSLAVALRRRLA